MNTENNFSQKEKAQLQTERTLSDAELIGKGAQYVSSKDGDMSFDITDKQYEELHQQMEELLVKNVLTDENIKEGRIKINVEKVLDNKKTDDQKIGYEFEIETETRYIISPCKIEDYKWENHVTDTYDQSGRARIRIKNGKPRLSLKVPLFTKDTLTAKTCLRLEFKPDNEKQEMDLIGIKELILKEAGAQTSEKWGAALKMKNGLKTWINRDSNNNWWIELDEGVEFVPPENIEVLRTEKSTIKTK